MKTPMAGFHKQFSSTYLTAHLVKQMYMHIICMYTHLPKTSHNIAKNVGE